MMSWPQGSNINANAYLKSLGRIGDELGAIK